MPISQRRRTTQLFLEALEERCNPSPTLIANIPLVQPDSNWNYTIPTNASPIMADLDGNGQQEILAPGGDGNLYAYKFNGGGISLYRQFFCGPWAAPIESTPVVANYSGRLVVFAANTNGIVFAWDAQTGGILPGWPVGVSVGGTANGVTASLAAGDLEGHGSPDLVVTSFNHEVTAFRIDGSILWRFNNDDTVFSGVAIGDLNRDGHLEVVVGGDSSPSQFYWQGGRINVLSADGRRVWVKQTDQVIWSSPVLADLQGTGKLDVVVGTGYFYPEPTGAPFVGNTIYALDPNGNDLPGWPYSTGPSSVDARVYASPAIADLQGNGTLDVIEADSQGRVEAIQPNGQALWVTQAFTPQNFYGSPIVADINGSGHPSVIMAAGNGGSDGIVLRAFDGLTGQQDFQYPNAGQPARPHYTAAVVGALEGNPNQLQMALIANDLSGGQLLSPSFLEVFNLDPSSLAPPWGQLRQDGFANAVSRSTSVSTNLITQLFTNAESINPSASQIASELAAFTRAPSLRQPILSMDGSTAARTLVIQGAYTTFLGRQVDQFGLNAWLNFLAQGNSDASMEANVAGSGEAFADAGGTNQGWVSYLYSKILGRGATPAEVGYWVSLLNAGQLSRPQVVIGFLLSLENTDKLVNQWYQQYGLGTPSPDNLEAAGWDLRRGKTEEQTLADVLTSNGNYVSTQTEASWLQAAYHDMLQRDISVGETASWLSQMEAGLPLSTIASVITHSGEYNAVLVNTWYRNYLGRTPGPAEVANVVNYLNAGGSRSGFLLTIFGSDEYFARAGGTVGGYINKVFADLLGRFPGPSEQTFWLNVAATSNIRQSLPLGILFQAPNEYNQDLVSQWFYQLLRRFPSTPSDQSRLIAAGTPFGGQAFADALNAGGNQVDIQTVILASGEYQDLALRKAFWNGARWLS
jgi:hypothetical protein